MYWPLSLLLPSVIGIFPWLSFLSISLAAISLIPSFPVHFQSQISSKSQLPLSAWAEPLLAMVSFFKSLNPRELRLGDKSPSKHLQIASRVDVATTIVATFPSDISPFVKRSKIGFSIVAFAQPEDFRSLSREWNSTRFRSAAYRCEKFFSPRNFLRTAETKREFENSCFFLINKTNRRKTQCEDSFNYRRVFFFILFCSQLLF